MKFFITAIAALFSLQLLSADLSEGRVSLRTFSFDYNNCLNNIRASKGRGGFAAECSFTDYSLDTSNDLLTIKKFKQIEVVKNGYRIWIRHEANGYTIGFYRSQKGNIRRTIPISTSRSEGVQGLKAFKSYLESRPITSAVITH